jgi:predicted PurR-regulated permease PerM
MEDSIENPQSKEREGKDSQKIFLDTSSLSLGTVFRVVLLTLAIIYFFELSRGILSSLGTLIFLIIISILFAYFIAPIVRVIRKPFEVRNLERLMPQPLAITIAFVFVFLVFGIAISYISPVAADQARRFAENFPSYTSDLEAKIKDLNSRYENYQISGQIQEQIANRTSDALTFAGSRVTAFLISVAGYLPWLILVPILSFFFLKDAKTLRNSFLRFFPSGNWRARVEAIVEDVNATLAAYTRAQLISCLLIGSVCTAFFYILGVDYALLLGIAAGVLEFIPMLGPLAIGLVATAVAGFSGSFSQAVWVAGFLIVLRIIQDYVTYPRIIREGIHLHPLLVILSVLAGEQIGGLPGVFISIPVVALLTVIYRHVLESRGRSGLFSGFGALDKRDAGEKIFADDKNSSE